MDTWRLTGTTARFVSESWQADFDINRPARGLHAVADRADADALSGVHFLGVHLPDFGDPIPDEISVEQYVRQRDFTIGYEADQPSHLRPQLDWRPKECDVQDGDTTLRLHGMRLLVSLATNRLDGRPSLSLTTLVNSSAVITCIPPAAAAMLNASPRAAAPPITIFHGGSTDTWIQLVYPTDAFLLELLTEDGVGTQATLRLLDEHLEKGVIRRVQAEVWRVPGSERHLTSATEISDQLFNRFVTAPPPISV